MLIVFGRALSYRAFSPLGKVPYRTWCEGHNTTLGVIVLGGSRKVKWPVSGGCVRCKGRLKIRIRADEQVFMLNGRNALRRYPKKNVGGYGVLKGEETFVKYRSEKTTGDKRRE